MMKCILVIIVTSLICLLSSTSVVAFISCNSSSRQRQQTQQCTHDDDTNSVDVGELQFNLMNLIQIDDDISKQKMKLQSLASLLKALLYSTSIINIMSI